MRQRAISTLVLWALVIGLPLTLGNLGAVLLIVAASSLTQIELHDLLRRAGLPGDRLLAVTCGSFLTVGGYYGIQAGLSVGDLAFFAMLPCLLVPLLRPRPGAFLPRVASNLASLFFVAFSLSFGHGFIHEGQIALGVWAIAVAKFADVGALLTGKFLGRTPFAPETSPNKTWEGVLGGILWAILVSAGYQLLLSDRLPEGFTLVLAMALAVPVAAAGIAGDLLESALKRAAGVKDSGKLIPGIGGVFDVTDSLILALPVGYLLTAWL